MENHKVYLKNNYLKIVGEDSGLVRSGSAARITITPDGGQFLFEGVTGYPSIRMKLMNILKEDGSAYTAEEWEDFYTANTGNFNSGGATPLTLKANVSQSGTDAPVLDVITNTTGLTFTPYYNEAGGFGFISNESDSILTGKKLFMTEGGGYPTGNAARNVSSIVAILADQLQVVIDFWQRDFSGVGVNGVVLHSIIIELI